RSSCSRGSGVTAPTSSLRFRRKSPSCPDRPSPGPSPAMREREKGLFGREVLALVRGFRADHQRFADFLGLPADRVFDPAGDVGVFLEIGFGILAALADANAVIAEPGTRLLDQSGLHAEIEDLAHLRHAFAVHDVELDLLERR